MHKKKTININEDLISKFIESCREAGLKVTHQRIEIFMALLNSKDHPSAEMLHKIISERLPSISLDTVYRTLATFEQHDLISRINTSGSQARFEIVTSRHHHMICSRCNKVIDFHWPAFDEIDQPESVKDWGNISSKSVVVYGICKSCLSKS